MAQKYTVWVEGTDEEISVRKVTLSKAKSLARIGSQYGAPREVVRGVSGKTVRVYEGGQRVWPTSKRQLKGFLKAEIPSDLTLSKNPENLGIPPNLPKDLTKASQDQWDQAVDYLSRKSLRELRKMQRIISDQITIAFGERNTSALKNLREMESMLDAAISLREFGD